MQDIRISFEINRSSFEASSFKNGKKSLEICACDGEIRVLVLYDYNERPLELNGNIKLGDKVELVLLDYRIELYVNGKIADEEWPCGERLFALGDELDLGENAHISPYFNENDDLPCVISSFENAEGWRPDDGSFVGDCMPYVKNGEYHVFYLKDRHHHKSKWGMGAHQWAHISTKDFKTWSVHPMAVEITDKSEGSICTGSWIRKGGREYLYYTVRRAGLPALIRRSVSNDGYHFTKDESFCFTVSEKYDAPSVRDPKVFLGEDGLFHMLLTTSLVKENRGCLAHYVSSDMEKWDECEKEMFVSPNHGQPECPDYFKYNGKYYLVFTLPGKAQYMVSDKPFEGFAPSSDSGVECAGVPKGAIWNDRLIFVGFKAIDGYAGTMTFKAARATHGGALIFEEL